MRLPRGLDQLFAAALLAYQVSAGSAHATLDARQSNTSNVAPLSVGASSSWLGIDGNWSTIDLRVGSPAQVVHTLVSFNLYQTWVVLPQGCTGAASPGACGISRGGIFNPANSTTWDTIGIYQFAIEDNLGYTGNARFGYEEVGLGSSTQNLPTLRNTTVGAFAVEDFYLGLFGVNPKPTNFTQLSDGSPSYLGQLKEQGLIPSLAFGYTAGASYRSVPASLTLGGVDTARYVQNNVTLQLAVDNERDTVVAIQQISTPSQQTSSPVGTNLLPNPVYAFLDSSIAEFWLPLEACRAFEQEFGLTYDNTTELYLVNSTLHQTLLTRNASVSFVLGAQISGGQTVTITLPYAAFDLTATTPYRSLNATSLYFPLRRAQNSGQYTLGRAFFQEAYIVVDYENYTFNVSQAVVQPNLRSNIVAIQPGTGNAAAALPNGANAASGSGGHGLSGGAIAGIVVGSVVGFILLLLLLLWAIFACRRRRRGARPMNEKTNLIPTVPGDSSDDPSNKAELEGSTPIDQRLGTSSGDGGSVGNGPSPQSTRGGPFTAALGGAAAGAAATRRFGRFHEHTESVGTSSQDDGGTSDEPPRSSQSNVPFGAAGAAIGRPFSPLSETASQSSRNTASVAGTDPRERILVHEMMGDLPPVGEMDGTSISERGAPAGAAPGASSLLPVPPPISPLASQSSSIYTNPTPRPSHSSTNMRAPPPTVPVPPIPTSPPSSSSKLPVRSFSRPLTSPSSASGTAGTGLGFFSRLRSNSRPASSANTVASSTSTVKPSTKRFSPQQQDPTSSGNSSFSGPSSGRGTARNSAQANAAIIAAHSKRESAQSNQTSSGRGRPSSDIVRPQLHPEFSFERGSMESGRDDD